MSHTKALVFAIASLGMFAACGGEEGGPLNEGEVITTVVLNFEPMIGATTIAEFDDPDGDGGQPPTVDPINLNPGTYTLTIQLQNRLETPAEEITDEVTAEADQHLVLLTGSAVVGPATANASGPLTHTYADTDSKGLPIGLTNTITAAAGTGQLTITLRHMPPEEPPVKAATTPEQVKDGGFNAIGGSTDVQVNFDVTVQ